MIRYTQSQFHYILVLSCTITTLLTNITLLRITQLYVSSHPSHPWCDRCTQLWSSTSRITIYRHRYNKLKHTQSLRLVDVLGISTFETCYNRFSIRGILKGRDTVRAFTALFLPLLVLLWYFVHPDVILVPSACDFEHHAMARWEWNKYPNACPQRAYCPINHSFVQRSGLSLEAPVYSTCM